jgi:peptide deformylase
MTILEIGNPTLRKIAQPVSTEEIASKSFQNFLQHLVETMRKANGAGLAAPQIGNPIRVFAAEVNKNPRYPYKPELPLTIVINPEIEFLTQERFINFEGCLSVPGIRGQIKRCPHIKVKGLTPDGELFEQEYFGITAGTFQHEFDHLNGTLFIDRVTDSTTLCTWETYEKFYAKEFRVLAEQTIAKYGG